MCTVLKAGMLTTVQDYGRFGYRAYGVPVSGVMDSYAATIANLLVGNSPDAAVLEMTMLGGSFYFPNEAYIALSGADMRASLNGKPVKNWAAFYIPANSELIFGYATSGCRAYLAFYGGIALPRILGSCSTYTRAAIGGLDGRALQNGDVIEIGKGDEIPFALRELQAAYIPKYGNEIKIRLILGPQDDLFTPEGRQTLFNGNFIISPRNDRMGIMLEGSTIQHINGADIISDALSAGAIQVPGDGHPIIMMADCQTTGGYAKIGFVISADLPKLAQAKAGDRVIFMECSDEEAVAACMTEKLCYQKIITV